MQNRLLDVHLFLWSANEGQRTYNTFALRLFKGLYIYWLTGQPSILNSLPLDACVRAEPGRVGLKQE
jgi:hypothetical protein